jgi:hypothetical protein
MNIWIHTCSYVRPSHMPVSISRSARHSTVFLAGCAWCLPVADTWRPGSRHVGCCTVMWHVSAKLCSSMYACVEVCMYVHKVCMYVPGMCMRMYVCAHSMYVCVCVCMYVHKVCMYVCISRSVYVCMCTKYVCMCMSMYVCMYACAKSMYACYTLHVNAVRCAWMPICMHMHKVYIKPA